MYEKIRKGRATRVQQASAMAGETMDERIGFNRLTPHEMAVAAVEGKLTGKRLILTLSEIRLIRHQFPPWQLTR